VRGARHPRSQTSNDFYLNGEPSDKLMPARPLGDELALALAMILGRMQKQIRAPLRMRE